MYRKMIAAALPIFAVACASVQTPPATSVPARLKPGPNEALVMVIPAQGVQIYECRENRYQAGTYEWAFVAPEAELFDSTGRKAGTHYAGPHWEANDGSRIFGKLKERVDAPRGDAIPWLLLTTKSVGPQGAFSRISSIQRVNTVGGVAPASGCSRSTAGNVARVPYTADYYLLSEK